ncbi:MAG: fibrobacter succinogenes major paralogous domain-containing protein [Fibrobacteres bacterium]|nr:fibrobacter succinogenes major paralogous domain-containing protein [Fibrobacterota bacterium]
MTIPALLALAASCWAQSINITGKVSDKEGRGIEDVMVRLGKANLATRTGLDGSFTLAGSGTDFPFLLKDNRLVLNVEKSVAVRVEALDIDGAVVVAHGQVVSPEERSISLPRFSDGMHIHRITIKDKEYSFTDRSGLIPHRGTDSSGKGGSPVKEAGAGARIDDALIFSKAGYLLYRLPMSSPDTSAIRITMAPLMTGTIRDVDGNSYRTVRFGHQEWTIENLKTTKYDDGTPITNVPDSASWLNIYLTGSSTPAYGIYGGGSPRKAKYGLFYNWYAVHTGKLAPKGWRVPTDADWDTLQNYLIAGGYNYDGTTKGNRIAKSMATEGDWCSSTLEGAIGNDQSKNNTSGFSALPGGLRHWGGSYYSLFEEQILTYLWSSTEYDSVRAWHRYLDCNKSFFDRLFHHKNTGFPVRVVRDVN